MKTVQEKIAVMQAYVEGKTIQIYQPSKAEWEDWCGTHQHRAPNFDWGRCNYRIKVDMDEQALKLYSEVPPATYFSGDVAVAVKRGLRAVIDAVKRGDIT